MRKLGYDIISIAEESPSIRDEEILTNAYLTERIILTNDKDFGDLIFLNKLQHKGVILFRLKSENVKDKIKAIDSLLKHYQDKLFGSFVVVDEEKVSNPFLKTKKNMKRKYNKPIIDKGIAN